MKAWSPSDSMPIPPGWSWAHFGDLLVAPLCNGLSIRGSPQPPGVPALRLSAMSADGFDYTDVRYLPITDERAEKILVEAGDFFISRGNGSLHLVARGTLAQGPPFRVIFPDTMIRARFAEPLRETSWVPAIWSSLQVRRQLESRVKTTAGIYKISQKDLVSVTLPMPPRNEQRRIVEKVEALTERSSRAREALEKIPPLLERFRQSVLAAAFRGDLTAEWREQNPDVEPASVLLERIRAKRRRRWEEDYLAKQREKGNEPKNDKWKAKYKPPATVGAADLPTLPSG